jgi:ABC-type transport system involved in multi-copper enzyme maturation permease subunit
MLAAVLGLVVSAIAVHAFGLPLHRVASGSNQLGIFIDVGENLGSLFAALVGAMAFTGEIRHGTIRPTLLGTPQRGRVLAAKAVTVLAIGIGFGVLATGAAAASGDLFLGIRHVSVHVSAGDYALLIAGGAAAAALWAVIGLGAGAVVRSQVPTMVGLLVWVLFVENILTSSIPSIGKFAPGTLGRAIAGATSGTVNAPAVGALVLALYAALAIGVGWVLTARRDFA